MCPFDLSVEYQAKLENRVRDVAVNFTEWHSPATQLQKLLRDTAERLQTMRWGVNIARLTGSSVSLGIGVPLMIAGTIAIPFTFGLSTALLVAGTAVSAVGGVTAGGASLTEHFLRKGQVKQLKDLQTQLEDSSPKLLESMIELKAILLESVFRNSPQLDQISAEPQLPPPLATAGMGAVVAGNLAGVGLRVAVDYSDDVVRWVGTGTELGGALGSTAARVALGSVFAGLAAAVDVWTIVDSSLNMAKDGNRYRAIQELETKAEQIEKTIHETKRLLNQAEGVAQGDAPSILKLAQETFVCCVCLEVASSPMARCPSCQALVGCRPCVIQALASRPQCPKCRASWDDVHDHHLIRGFDDWLEQLKKF